MTEENTGRVVATAKHRGVIGGGSALTGGGLTFAIMEVSEYLKSTTRADACVDVINTQSIQMTSCLDMIKALVACAQ